jgi:hypothetical protein
MSDSRLLIAIAVFDFLAGLKKTEQRAVIDRFRQIAEFPSNFVDFVEKDAAGRTIGVHIYGKFAIKFWDDQADRDLKIVDLHLADRTR